METRNPAVRMHPAETERPVMTPRYSRWLPARAASVRLGEKRKERLCSKEINLQGRGNIPNVPYNIFPHQNNNTSRSRSSRSSSNNSNNNSNSNSNFKATLFGPAGPSPPGKMPGRKINYIYESPVSQIWKESF